MAEYNEQGQELFDAIVCPNDKLHKIDPDTNLCLECGAEVVAIDEHEFLGE